MGDLFKKSKRWCFLAGVNVCIPKEGLKNREEPSLHSCADSHGLASTEQEHYAMTEGWHSIILDYWCLLFYKLSSGGGNM